MPEGLTLETTPEPLDERVKIVEIPERVLLRYGFQVVGQIQYSKRNLKKCWKSSQKAEIETVGQVFTMRYNGPFTPWFMRRNEVAVEVEL